MLNNGIIKSMALVAVLGLAACGNNQEAPIAEDPATETPAPAFETEPQYEADPMAEPVEPVETDTVIVEEDTADEAVID